MGLKEVLVSGILVLRLRYPAHLKCFFFTRIMAASPGQSLRSGHHAGLTSPGAAPVGMPFYRACHRSCPRRLELGRTPAGAPVTGHFSGAAAGMTSRGLSLVRRCSSGQASKDLRLGETFAGGVYRRTVPDGAC